MNKIHRRTAIKTLGAAGASLILPCPSLAGLPEPHRSLTFGVIADLHGGLAADAEDRLTTFLEAMQNEACDGLIQLGDFAYPNPAHQQYPNRLNAAHENVIHVIGNHEFDYGLKREDCFRAWDIDSSYYVRDFDGLRMIVLDGNETGSPTHRGGYPSFIGNEQLSWLEKQLEQSPSPVIILSHQPLAGVSAVNNAKSIQQLLGRYHSKIVICLNGHSHVDSFVQRQGVTYLHINSASYFWVGGETRMAYYGDPLFATLKVDPETATLTIRGRSSKWRDQSPEEIGYFKRENAPPRAIVTPQIRNHHISKSKLKVMTWNIWGRLNQEPRYTVNQQTARQRVIDILRESQSDIVAMIETYGSAADIAEALDFHHYTTADDANLCIFSRYPLSKIKLAGLNPFSFIAATVTLPSGKKIRVYNVWLTSGGRHIVEIKNEKTDDEQFTRGDDLRFDHLQQLLKHPTFQQHANESESIPLIVAGDFNCVSHLDYTEETRQAQLNQSRILPIKVSRAMQSAGFVDAYRKANPKVTQNTLGYTWTTVGPDFRYEESTGFVPAEDNPEPEYRSPFARIDYIYKRGKKLNTIAARVIRHHPSEAQHSFPEFPSDHAAVVAEFEVLE